MDSYTITRSQIDQLSVADARRVCQAIWDAGIDAKGDDVVDCFEPLTRMIERALLERPAHDLQTLATKVWVACRPISEDEPDMVALWSDIEGILSPPA